MQATQTNGQDSIGGIRFVNETDTILSGSVGSGHDYVALTELKSETLKRTAGDARLGEAGVDEESDSDSGNSFQQQQAGQMKTGKKTKGRVKIKMEFIENKLRRYTTFSKRKTGIMKKVSNQKLSIIVFLYKNSLSEAFSFTLCYISILMSRLYLYICIIIIILFND